MSDQTVTEKAQYEALHKQGRSRRPADLPGNPAIITADLIQQSETIPGGWGSSFLVPRGQTLRIVNKDNTPGVSVLLYNAKDPSERFNAGDTVKVQWSARLGKGMVLFSDMGRVLASITDDTYGFHDALTGGSSPLTNAEKYCDATLRNTRENFLLLAAKHGLGRADIPPCLTLFAPVVVDEKGQFLWTDQTPSQNSYVDLRAEMDLLIFVSNCPHPLSPGAFAPTPVDVLVWQSPAPDQNDPCRTLSEEARRGFENTDALFA